MGEGALTAARGAKGWQGAWGDIRSLGHAARGGGPPRREAKQQPGPRPARCGLGSSSWGVRCPSPRFLGLHGRVPGAGPSPSGGSGGMAARCGDLSPRALNGSKRANNAWWGAGGGEAARPGGGPRPALPLHPCWCWGVPSPLLPCPSRGACGVWRATPSGCNPVSLAGCGAVKTSADVRAGELLLFILSFFFLFFFFFWLSCYSGERAGRWRRQRHGTPPPPRCHSLAVGWGGALLPFHSPTEPPCWGSCSGGRPLPSY